MLSMLGLLYGDVFLDFSMIDVLLLFYYDYRKGALNLRRACFAGFEARGYSTREPSRATY